MAMSFSTKEYFVRETYKSIRRNGFMSFASISTVAVSLLVLGMFLLIFLNTNHLAKFLESQVQVSVYMEDSADEEALHSVEAQLQKLPGVVKVTAVGKEQALARFKERLGDQDKLLDALGEDNPFPNSFDVQVDTPERIKEITPVINEMDKVESAKFGQEVVEHLFQLTRILRFGGIALVIFGYGDFIYYFQYHSSDGFCQTQGSSDYEICRRNGLVYPLALPFRRYDIGLFWCGSSFRSY